MKYVLVMTNLNPPYGALPMAWRCGTVFWSGGGNKITVLEVEAPPATTIATLYRAFVAENQGADNQCTIEELPQVIAAWRVDDVKFDGAALRMALAAEGEARRLDEVARQERAQLALLQARHGRLP